jgi:hypothetical protein
LDYPLENLDPERFQQICQALLIREHPDVQCFPVAQPDAGRDAISYVFSRRNGKFVVYQVKFARRPLADVDPHKWLMAIAEDEAPKISALIPKGATKYYLITNVPGTAHADSGSIDKLNRLLSKTMGVPSVCWWRDDLNRRLDDAWSIKWAYPDLMTGPDFLRALVESGLSEHKERRSSAIRAFLRSQYEVDEEVRFKQVELQNKLLDLFIDVPMALRDTSSERKRISHVFNLARIRHRQPPEAESLKGAGYEFESRCAHAGDELIGAASFLLSPIAQANISNLVLEGAPGQGKSTIAQYVCQVNRMKLLQQTELLEGIPHDHRSAPIRLPVKIDLRDFATWLNRRNPFAPEDS